MSSLQLLAYDGPEGEQHQRYIWERLDEALGNCDLCIRQYYIAKLDFLSELREEYEESDIKTFFALINRRDIQRIETGLDATAKVLREIPEQKRGPSALEPKQLHAVFEALICQVFLQDETKLKEHFDEPFRLIQSKKPLRIREYLPATAKFLFDSNTRRIEWATGTWNRIERSPSDIEWTWAIKDIVQTNLQQATSPEAIARFWSALVVIVGKLDEHQITYNLCDLVPNVCTTALNHLARPTLAIGFITKTIKSIIEKAPDAFWSSMGSISSATIVEQVFASPRYNKVLENQVAQQNSIYEIDSLSWIASFVESLKPANRPAACQTIVYQLFERVKNKDLDLKSRQVCFEMSVKVILQTIISFSDDERNRQSVERLVLCDALNIISHRIDDLLRPTDLAFSDAQNESIRSDVLSVVRNSLALECQCLKSDFETLHTKESQRHESSSYSADIWKAVVDNLSEDDVKLSSAALLGIMPLPGLEKFRVRGGKELSKQQLSYNSTFEKLTGMVSKMLERLSEFKPDHLDILFRAQDTSMSLVAALFSADQSTYEAAIELVKNISGQSGRSEALAHLLGSFSSVTIYGLCWIYRRISNMKTFASVPRMLKTGMEILDALCNPTSGMLRTQKLQGRDSAAIQSYWSYQWIALRTVFKQTEPWSLEVHDKPLMTDVCRDAMQYAEALSEQYDLFASVLIKAKPDRADEVPKLLLDSSETPSGSPLKTIDAMSKWLRLRDQYLADTLVKLITRTLGRLKSHNVLAENDGLAYVQEVATKTTIKTILSDAQKAVLVRALENYYGKQIERPLPKKQSTLKQWAGPTPSAQSETSTPASRGGSVDDFGDSEIADEDFYEVPDSSTEAQKLRTTSKEKDQNKFSLLKQQAVRAKPPVESLLSVAARQKEKSQAFIENRKREEAARKARDKEAALKLRGKAGISEHTSGQGSGLAGIGVRGKDHSAGQSSMMVSSDSDSESEDSDEEIFGRHAVQGSLRGPVPGKAFIHRGPVRKVKQVRSQKDVRARLAPDLSTLHKTILSWDFFADTDLPPNSAKDDYSLVTNTFRTVEDYQKTFEPLLVLEGWQSFRAAREDGTFKSFEIKVSNSLIVDNFFELNSSMSFADGKELGLNTADVVLLSKSKRPGSDPNEPHCLARVKETSRKKGQFQIVFRLNAADNPLRSSLKDEATIWGAHILSLTTLEREYGALMALPYYDLAEEIIRAKPSPLLEYSDDQLRTIISTYDVNAAQAKAVKSALDNDAFSLIQGPPGSGKTKTICALVGAMMTGFLNTQSRIINAPRLNNSRASQAPPSSKKVLVCAPSNAAVDELVIRFKEGVKLMNGSTERLNVVRLGRSEAVNSNVKDCILDELVNAKLNISAPSNDAKEDILTVMKEHKAVSDELNKHKDRMAQQRATGQPVSTEDETLFDGLKRKRNQLSTKIDDLRARQNSASRDMELNRKRAQQEILDSAHVLCATLSGSGHEFFQSLNIEFETVIIDEAAQSIELSALIPLKYGCSKCILVGDPKQLPPTVLSRQAAKFQYEQSLFARMENNHRKDVHLLDTQYRMHPEISIFPSKTFYDSRLKDGAGMAKLRARPWHHSKILAPYRFFDVQGMSQAAPKGHSLVNVAELNVAMQLYDRLLADVPKYDFKRKIGIITPYKGQLQELRRRFSQRYGETVLSEIDFNTTDAFQGRESEIIIFSCVRASTKGIGFLNDIRRMNVGLTRAKCSLWVLGNSEALVQGEFWRSLINDAKTRNLYTDGDVLRLLGRPLLTEDMMKDDVMMMDAGSPVPVPQKDVAPVRQDSALERKNSTVLQNVAAKPVKKEPDPDIKQPKITRTEPSPKSVSSRTTPLPSRPSSPGSRSSSSSFSSNTAKQIKPQAQSSSSPHASSRSITPRSETETKPKMQHSYKPTPLRQGSNVPDKGPSGGRTGLNDMAKCPICGSDQHYAYNCDNENARAASLGDCYRCHQPGHTKDSCFAPRCLSCGEVGHVEGVCQAPLKSRLTKEQQESVQKQEIKHGIIRDNAREKRAAKQLGEHAAAIPLVRSTLPPVQVKRKREDGLDEGVPKQPRAMRASDGGLPRQAENMAGHPPSGVAKGMPRPPGGGSARPGVPQAGLVRKKKVKTDDMFMKRR